jgi:hypothetical protein
MATAKEISRHLPVVLLLMLASLLASATFAQSAPAPRIVKAYVQGDSSRLADFVQECQREFPLQGLKLEVVPFDNLEYNIVIAQESSIGGAAASAVVLDRSGHLVASVVRSGRMSGKGAFNATVSQEAGRPCSAMSRQNRITSVENCAQIVLASGETSNLSALFEC